MAWLIDKLIKPALMEGIKCSQGDLMRTLGHVLSLKIRDGGASYRPRVRCLCPLLVRLS